MNKMINNKIFVLLTLFIMNAQPLLSMESSYDVEAVQINKNKKTPWWKTTYAKIAGGITAAVGVVALGYTVNNARLASKQEAENKKAEEHKRMLSALEDDLRKELKYPVNFVLGIDTPQDKKENSLLLMTVQADGVDYALVERLLKAGAKIDFQNAKDMNALMYAAKYNKSDLLKLLIANGSFEDKNCFAHALLYVQGLARKQKVDSQIIAQLKKAAEQAK